MNLLELTLAMGLSATIFAGSINLYAGAVKVYTTQHNKITRLIDAYLVLQAIDADIKDREDPLQGYPQYSFCKPKALLYRKPSYIGKRQEILRNVVAFEITKSKKILLAVKIDGKIKKI